MAASGERVRDCPKAVSTSWSGAPTGNSLWMVQKLWPQLKALSVFLPGTGGSRGHTPRESQNDARATRAQRALDKSAASAQRGRSACASSRNAEHLPRRANAASRARAAIGEPAHKERRRAQRGEALAAFRQRPGNVPLSAGAWTPARLDRSAGAVRSGFPLSPPRNPPQSRAPALVE